MNDEVKVEASVEDYMALADANDVDGANAYVEKHFGKAGEEGYDEAGYKAFAEEVIAASVARITEVHEAAAEVEAEVSEEATDEANAE